MKARARKRAIRVPLLSRGCALDRRLKRGPFCADKRFSRSREDTRGSEVELGNPGNERRRAERRPIVAECRIEGLSSRADMRLTDLSLNGGYVDAYRSLHMEEGWTFPAWDPHVRLDYVFVPQKYADRVRSCDVMNDIREPAKATDHLPLVAEIDI